MFGISAAYLQTLGRARQCDARARRLKWARYDAVELCAQLEGVSIPDDFQIAGEYSQTIAAVRQGYTDYDALLDALPVCPEACPIADGMGDPIGPGCISYDLAHDILRTNARRLALELYCAWHAGSEVPPEGR